MIDEKLGTEISRHFMKPENYGKLEDATCVGMGIDNTTNSYAIIYLKLSDTNVEDVMFASNSTQDVNTLGSIFTEMIKGEEIVEALKITLGLEQDLQKAYDAIPAPKIDLTKPEGEQVEHVSTEYQDCANMVLTSFRAALRHKDRLAGGIQEDEYEMNIVKSCPYSGTECHFGDVEKKED